MIPFDKEYYEKTLKDFRKKCRIKENLYLNSVRLEYEYKYNYENSNYKCIKLIIDNDVAMIVSPLEIYQCYEAIKKARGIVCIVGLGLGYFLQQIIDNDEVKKIIVFEINKDVIELYKMNFKENKKVVIINKDVFKCVKEFKKVEFDFLFCDIYTYKVTEKNIKDYIYLNKNLNIKNYTFFGVERLVLNMKKYHLNTNIIPKFWLSISEDMEMRLNKSQNIIKPIKYDEIIKIYNFIESNPIFGCEK